MRCHTIATAILALLAVPVFAGRPAAPATSPATKPAAPTPTKPAERVVKVKNHLQIELVDLSPGETSSLTAAVDANGAIRLPLVGDVPAAGRTLGQLERDIKDAYEKKGLVKGMTVAVQFADVPI